MMWSWPALILIALAGAGETGKSSSHWAFQPPVRTEPPATKHAGWARNPIDQFILHDLEEVGLGPASEASRATLIRRLTFDLHGLPPTPEEVAAFVADDRPDAYERLVDRLLASPRYGERWARQWLDLARYSESDGFKSDKTRPNAWRYRDWVINALNEDLPYDRFVALQIAGDAIAPADPSAFIATGFNRNYPFEDNNMVPGLNRQLMLDDMTDTTASVFLGLTVACARCHDHKYDPISQKDYYRFQAVFAEADPKDDRPLSDTFTTAVHEFVERAHSEKLAVARRSVETVEKPYAARLLGEKLAALPEEVRKAFETEPLKRSAFQEELLAKNAKKMAVDAKAMKAAMTPEDRKRWEAASSVMQAVTKEAPAPLPSASGFVDMGSKTPPVHIMRKGTFGQPLDEVDPGFPTALTDSSFEPNDRRAALASWLASPKNPLTARVMVNRLWQGHFGRGIVATPSDFGTQGARPSNLPLLDWLTTEFVARGWSLKAMHRLMVTSATYRQSTRASEKAVADDPDNLLFGRMPRRRLEGEAVRDAMLAVAGRLNTEMGGPSVFPDLPPGVQTRGGWSRSVRESDRDRRSIYVFARRNLVYPLFDVFDAPDPNTTCAERNVSVNSPQALMLMNSELVLTWAESFAKRIEGEAGDDPNDRIERTYQIALGRTPEPRERQRALAFLASGRTLSDLCHAVLNLNEFVFID